MFIIYQNAPLPFMISQQHWIQIKHKLGCKLYKPRWCVVVRAPRQLMRKSCQQTCQHTATMDAVSQGWRTNEQRTTNCCLSSRKDVGHILDYRLKWIFYVQLCTRISPSCLPHRRKLSVVYSFQNKNPLSELINQVYSYSNLYNI